MVQERDHKEKGELEVETTENKEDRDLLGKSVC